MRATSLTVAALAAALLLTACDDGGSGGGSKSGSTPAAQGDACTIGKVDIQVGPANAAPSAGDTGNVPVTLTNKGGTCTLKGFPGVDLNAASMSTSVTPQKGAKAVKLTLAKDAAATFTLTYVRGKAGDKSSLDAKTLEISLPGAGTQKSFKWSYGPVQGQDGPGNPNASVSAFQQAGD